MEPMRVSCRRQLLVGLLAVTCAAPIMAGGCRPTAPRRPLLDQDPIFVIPAMKRTAESQRLKDIPRLIELLDSEDAAIRLNAIQTLRSLTGETFGYQFWDTALQRGPAVARWRGYAVDLGLMPADEAKDAPGAGSRPSSGPG